ESVRERVLAMPLERFTRFTPSSPERLRLDLEKIARESLAQTYAEIDDGIYAVAAPILNANGELVASICVAGLASRIKKPVRRDLAAAVAGAAASISQSVGVR